MEYNNLSVNLLSRQFVRHRWLNIKHNHLKRDYYRS